jgi:hypothetical protein
MDLQQGALEMLVLRSPRLSPRHGYGTARTLRFQSGEALAIEFGSLNSALKHQKQFRRERAKWTGFAAAVARIMRPERASQ